MVISFIVYCYESRPVLGDKCEYKRKMNTKIPIQLQNISSAETLNVSE